MKIRPSFKRFFVLLAAPLAGTGLAAPTNHDAEPHIAIPTPVPRPRPNGFDLYVAAKKALIPVEPPVDAIIDPWSSRITPAQQAQNYSLARKRAWLATNKPAFALFQQAMKTPTMTPVDRDDNNYPYAAYQWLRELACCKTIEAKVAKMENHPAEAVRSSLDTIQMGIGIQRGGGPSAEITGFAIAAIGRSNIEDFDVTINMLNAQQAGAAAKRLEVLIAHQSPATQVMQEGRWQRMTQLKRLFKDPNWRGNPSDWTLGGPEWKFKELVQAKTVSTQQIVDRVNHSYDEAIRVLQLPYDPIPKPENPLGDPYSEILGTTGANHFVAKEALNNVGLKLLLLRLALRAYRSQTGDYPASLSKLAPRYLKAIPTDDFNKNNPFYYHLKEKSYELWSVGPDGKNDNGKPILSHLLDDANRPATVGTDPERVGDYVAGKNR